jgi:hypothetical protein
MARHESVLSLSVPAAADLSTHQFKFMEVDGNGRVNVANASTDLSMGVLQGKPSAIDQPAEVAILGRVKVIAGATVAAGARVMSNASGLAITAATTGNIVKGLCLKGGAVNELLEIDLFPGGYPIP